MSEQTKVFKLKKVTPKNVIFALHPLSNPSLSRKIILSDRNPYQMLPLDWALGVFNDDGIYSLYKKGYITFDKNEELVKEAYLAGAYFSEVLEFEPSKEEQPDKILAILKGGNRSAIEKAIKDFGQDVVKSVATEHVKDLSMGVVGMLENIFKCQLVIDGENDEEGNN